MLMLCRPSLLTFWRRLILTVFQPSRETRLSSRETRLFPPKTGLQWWSNGGSRSSGPPPSLSPIRPDPCLRQPHSQGFLIPIGQVGENRGNKVVFETEIHTSTGSYIQALQPEESCPMWSYSLLRCPDEYLHPGNKQQQWLIQLHYFKFVFYCDSWLMLGYNAHAPPKQPLTTSTVGILCW